MYSDDNQLNITLSGNHSSSTPYVRPAYVDFNKLTGILRLSLFIHNAVVALVINNEDSGK